MVNERDHRDEGEQFTIQQAPLDANNYEGNENGNYFRDSQNYGLDDSSYATTTTTTTTTAKNFKSPIQVNSVYEVQKIFLTAKKVRKKSSESNRRRLSQVLGRCPIRLINALCRILSLHYLWTLAILVLTTTCSLCAASLCNGQSWWDPSRHKCTPCTVCKGDMVPLRPCQIHQDTICGSIYDLEIDWVLLSRTEPNWKERRKFEDNDYGFDHHHLTAEQLQQLENEIVPLDWQTAALFLAVLACLLFFIVAACILVHHMRQWRRMERRLDQDVEELSTRLMAKLAEVQSLEGGTFFIGNADALGLAAAVTATTSAPTTVTMTNAATAAVAFHQPQHVALPEKTEKYTNRQFLSTLKSGNVYIEENGSKC